jgi:hypothetical protein
VDSDIKGAGVTEFSETMGSAWSNWEDVGMGETLRAALDVAKRKVTQSGYRWEKVAEVSIANKYHTFVGIDGYWYQVYSYSRIGVNSVVCGHVHIDLNYVCTPPRSLEKQAFYAA